MSRGGWRPASRPERLRLAPGLILCILLAACLRLPPAATALVSTPPSQPEQQAAFTAAVPSPTTTPEPSPSSQMPTSSPVPTRAPAVPTADETCQPGGCADLTPVATPTGSPPLAQVRILSPGQLSRVTSPLSVEAAAIPGPNGIIRIELLGESGRIYFRQIMGFATPLGERVDINPIIDFEIIGASEAARLQITVDDGYNRPIAVSSVDLTMLSTGEAEVNPAGEALDPYAITSPQPDQVVSGGKMSVSGSVRPVNDRMIAFQLIDAMGRVVGARQLSILPAEDGAYQPFQIEIPYSIQAPGPARLVIRQPGTRFPGDAALSSRMVYLTP